MTVGAEPWIVGREADVRQLLSVVDGLPGRGAGLLLRGEPGIGKSALLDLVVADATARGLRILRIAGDPADLAPGDRATTGSARLARAAGPLLVVVDDAQWLLSREHPDRRRDRDRAGHHGPRRVRRAVAGRRARAHRAQLARGITLLAAGDHWAATDAYLRLFEPGDPAHDRLAGSWVFDDLAEASLRARRGADAENLVGTVEAVIEGAGSPRSRSALLRARTLLADDAAAEGLFRQALTGPHAAGPYSRGR